MSTDIYGIKAPADEYKKMKAIWDECEADGTEAPDEIYEFFNDAEPSPLVQRVCLGKSHNGISELPGETGFLVDLKELPQDIRYLEFKNSW